MPSVPCTSLAASGAPCRFPARRDTTLCINHDPANRAAQTQQRQRATSAATRNRKLRAKQRSSSALYNLDAWALADRSSIQALLDAVIRMELAGRLPNVRARNLLRALAIAVRNFDTPPIDTAKGRTSRHNLSRYHHTRHSRDTQLEALLAEAEARDAARE
jgi:hypothetical protein